MATICVCPKCGEMWDYSLTGCDHWCPYCDWKEEIFLKIPNLIALYR